MLRVPDTSISNGAPESPTLIEQPGRKFTAASEPTAVRPSGFTLKLLEPGLEGIEVDSTSHIFV